MHPLAWRMQLAAQVEELRAGGSRVETVFPATEDEHLFGPNAMNPTLRPEAARPGHRVGAALAERLGAFWR
jgi:NTE family protein